MNVLSVLLFVLLALGCRTPPPIPTTAGPTLDPIEFFDGTLLVEGAVYGPLGRRLEAYAMEVNAGPDEDGVRVRETLRIHGGGESRTQYFMRSLGDGRYTVDSDDFIGPGAGERYGSGIRWRYAMVRKEGVGAGIRFKIRDYMIPRDPQTLDNYIEIRKLGMRVGYIEQVMRRR